VVSAFNPNSMSVYRLLMKTMMGFPMVWAGIFHITMCEFFFECFFFVGVIKGGEIHTLSRPSLPHPAPPLFSRCGVPCVGLSVVCSFFVALGNATVYISGRLVRLNNAIAGFTSIL